MKETSMPVLNPHLAGFECVRCAARFPVADYPEGCAVCLDAGYPASVVPFYDADLPKLGPSVERHGMARFGARLPYSDFNTLGEGDTPMVSLPRLADELGLESLHAKLESANPTGSHKDRMSAQFVARAKHRGAPAVIAASSGNAGASLAAYAALADIPCIIVTTRGMTPAWRRAIDMTGAEIVYAEDSMQRWEIVRNKVREEGYATATNYLDPPVGSDPYGVEGYKTLGYELAQDSRATEADVVVVPTSRGDLLWGIYRGLSEALAMGLCRRMPSLLVAEPFPRIQRVLEGEDYRGHFKGANKLASIGGATVTYQALEALRRSFGSAVAVSEADTLSDQKALARNGLYLELSAVAGITALRALVKRSEKSIRRAIFVATSHAYKES